MKNLTPENVKYIVIHCSANRVTDTHVDAAAIDRIHRIERQFAKIGYHKVIKLDGTVENGRPLDEPGAHVKGHNSHSIGVCLVGGCRESKSKPGKLVDDPTAFTAEQFVSLHSLLKQLKAKYPHAKVVGHNLLDPHKSCPVFNWRTYLATHQL